jgi:hypothetical protein
MAALAVEARTLVVVVVVVVCVCAHIEGIHAAAGGGKQQQQQTTTFGCSSLLRGRRRGPQTPRSDRQEFVGGCVVVVLTRWRWNPHTVSVASAKDRRCAKPHVPLSCALVNEKKEKKWYMIRANGVGKSLEKDNRQPKLTSW